MTSEEVPVKTNGKDTVQMISVRQMAKILKNFHVREGDIIALKHQSPLANEKAIDAILHAVEQMKINVLVLVVKDFDDLTVLNETDMNKRGWFRFKSMSRIVPGQFKEDVESAKDAEDEDA